MKRVVIDCPGAYDRLRVVEEADPSPGAEDVAMAVAAAGINYADCLIRMGLYQSARDYVGYPITPGFEVSGTVTEVGPNVTGVRPGDRVVAVTRFGAYASRLVIPHHQVFPLPPALDVEAAAGFPTVFLTAWYALFELAHPRPGTTLLVHSAAGGVGGALVQLGKVAGCRVIGVVGTTHKIDVARGYGADTVIDKSRKELWPAVEQAAPGGCDIVCDANGVATLGSYRHLAPTGKLVIYGFHSMMPRQGGRPNFLKLLVNYLRTPRFNPFRMTQQNRSVLAFNLSYLFDQRPILQEGMEQLLAWLEEGAIRPADVTAYPLEQVADAHRDLESGRTTGKLILRMEDDAA